MKVYTVNGGKLERKSADYERLFGDRVDTRTLTGTDYGLALAYGVGVWAYRCIQLRAQAIGGIPARIVGADGEPVENHPAALMFGDTASGLLGRIEEALCVWGVCYIEPVRNGLGKLHSLKWLNPQTVSPIVSPAGITGFFHSGGSRSVTFLPDELVYLQSFNPNNDLGGLGPLAVALAAVNADGNAVDYVRSFFGNGARIDGILTVPTGNNDTIDRVEAKWRKVFRGAANAFKTLVLGGQGITYTPVSSSPGDLAMAELRAENRRDICAAFGVPPVLTGAWEAANYATAAQQRAGFYTETILPECDFIEDELNRQVMAVYYPGYSLRFDTDGIDALQENELKRNQAISAGYQAGWLTRNEARRRAGLPPVEGGDEFTQAADPGVSAPFPFRANEDVEGEEYP